MNRFIIVGTQLQNSTHVLIHITLKAEQTFTFEVLFIGLQ